MKSDIVQFPNLTIEEKWNTAESNLVYFIVCGIAFAKTTGKTAEDFGTFSGNVANWENSKKREPKVLIEGIYRNKSQFKDFEMEIVRESEDIIEAKMRGFGENLVRKRRKQDITVDDYLRFFGKKWEAIAKQLELTYKQSLQGQWLHISVVKV
jgi:hypothetical protein